MRSLRVIPARAPATATAPTPSFTQGASQRELTSPAPRQHQPTANHNSLQNSHTHGTQPGYGLRQRAGRGGSPCSPRMIAVARKVNARLPESIRAMMESYRVTEYFERYYTDNHPSRGNSPSCARKLSVIINRARDAEWPPPTARSAPA